MKYYRFKILHVAVSLKTTCISSVLSSCLPHTDFSVKLAEKWRHYCRRSITQKQIVSVVSHRSNMHDAKRLWDQIAFFQLVPFTLPHPSTRHKPRAKSVRLCDDMRSSMCVHTGVTKPGLWAWWTDMTDITDMTPVACEYWLDTTSTSNIFSSPGERDEAQCVWKQHAMLTDHLNSVTNIWKRLYPSKLHWVLKSKYLFVKPRYSATHFFLLAWNKQMSIQHAEPGNLGELTDTVTS